MITFGYKRRFGGYLRAIVAFTLGVAMLIVGDDAMVLAVRLLAVLFMVSGIFSLVMAIIKSKGGAMCLSIASSTVSLVTAVLMFIFSGHLVTLIGYAIGVVLAGFGLLQLVVMIGASRVFSVGYMFFILPALVLVAGIFVIVSPLYFVDLLGVLTGVSLIIYGVSEFLSSRIMNKAKSESSMRQTPKE
jgi:uncharacterized membrane protein HdeD (DUF308 family)